MKRWMLLPLAAWLTWTAVRAPLAEGEAGQLKLAAKSAAMMDAETGQWLYVFQGDKPLPPASMSKMMTELLVLDDMAAGKLQWGSVVTVSKYAEGVPGAGMGLKIGDRVPVRELFNAMAIHSANDAAVALAEKSAGTEKAFVKRMNRKASELGLSRATQFANATGLSSGDVAGFSSAAADGETVMTAKDAAKLAAYLIKKHPEIVDTTRKAESVWKGSATPLTTTNEMLPGQRFGTAGNNGLKTGYTPEAGYCFTGTTTRNGRLLITVVMGTAMPEARFEETKKLLAYGWRQSK